MTRKDYVKIAAVIASSQEARPGSATPDSVHYQITHAMADMLACDNPRFDRAKFLRACGRAP